MEELDAGPVKLLQVFKGEKDYKSPIFQRQFVWGKKEISRLWNDIDAIIDGTEKTKFLGAIVLEVKSSGKSFQPDEYWIVDGQQRLTTLYIVILRLALEAERAGNNELAESLYKQYLFKQDGKYLNEPKLFPTIQDSTQFRHLFNDLQSRTPKLGPPYGETTGTLTSTYKLITREIKNRCYNNSTFDNDKATQLSETILEKLKFVQIILGSDQEPQQVYDALNNAGIKLLTKDIMRNKVFQGLSKDPEKAVAHYNGFWLPLESELKDRFDDFFFPFALVDKPSITKSNLCYELNERWKGMEPDKIVQDLRTYVPCYNALTSENNKSRDTLTDSKEVNNSISRLYRMNIPSTVYPFLFKLIDEFKLSKIDEDSTIHNLSLVESFLVRRAFAGYEPTGLHAVFKELWNLTRGSPEEFLNCIHKNPTVQFPDDKRFEENIRLSPLYTRRLAPYIIEEYERSLKGGDPHPESIKITLDHVMPKELTDEWKKGVDPKEHEIYKDTWANLVPLSGPANSQKGQKTWSTVRNFLMKETIFKTTKHLAQENEEWNIEKIKQRSDTLVAWAMERWQKS
jgi:hypothetical protein